MARKVKTTHEIILDCCLGSRYATKFFQSINDDAFVGYQTAAVKILNPNIDASAEELFNLIKGMVAKGEL